MQDKKNDRLYTTLAVTGLVLLCINPGITEGKDFKNLLLIAFMCISPAVLLIKGARVFIPRIDIPLCLTAFFVIANPLLFHPDSIRWITMLFTCAWCVYFMMLARLVRIAGLSAEDLKRIIRGVIYAFTIMLVIQQICVLTGLPVPNSAAVYSNPFKLNSLTAEPSHTTVTLATLMFFYTQTLRLISPSQTLLYSLRKEWPLWLCYVWTILTPVNASALLLGPLFLLPYITRRNILPVTGFAIIMILLVALTPIGNLTQVKRLEDTVVATLTFDDQAVMDADLSASARIVPTFRGARLIDPTDVDMYIGHGVDADQHDTPPRPCDYKENGFAGIFSLWHNYGAVAAISFWTAIASVTLIRRRWLSLVVFLFAIQMSADYNMQLVWLIMAFSMLFKYSVADDRKLLSTCR